MGVYCYTRRKDKISVHGMDIVRFAYAYKEHWGSSSSRTVNRLHTLAEKAYDTTSECKFAVAADGFAKAKEYSLPIYQLSNQGITSFLEEPKCLNEETNKWEPKVVGYLRKIGRDYYITKEAA